ncbi:MAG TPA: gluconate 2-dehydrogenase subunit 3 family protein [Saprospiraceae bacterium]|nr:gluconate 2-dehydrogenase subunit 3 family protein [Saprospiraceae bacterium]HMQ82202.1 gluconate 2-dehydrogenase subunit 3 family protein [Saprospiraceae bacterium]
MDRRTILKYTALATGTAVSTPLLSVILSGCRSEAAALEGYQPKFFTGQEMKELQQLVDVILPKTDTPAASELGVHQVIDSMAGEVYPSEFQKEFRSAYDGLSAYLKGEEFQNKDLTAQVELLQKLETSDKEALELVQQAFIHLKQQTIAYYLSTEEIGTKYLNYLPVPGEYKSCITVEEAGGKLWAI